MISVFLALVTSAPEAPVLSDRAACKLAAADRISPRNTYSIRGTYHEDWEWGAFLDKPKCKLPIGATLVGDADAKRDAWHEAFRAKCGGPLMNDYIRGVFTGTFQRRKQEFQGQSFDVEVFEISRVATNDLDPSTIKCPTK